MKQLSSHASRILFGVAVALAIGSVLEKAANLMGYTLTLMAGFTPSRLLELTAVALLFVIAIQLRELRHGTSAGPTAMDG